MQDQNTKPSGLFKYCNGCKRTLHLDNFWERRGRAGVQSRCKECHKGAHRQWAAKRTRKTLLASASRQVTEKRCARCKVTKPSSEFTIRRVSADGLRYECRACAAIVNRRNQAKEDPEKRRLRELRVRYGLVPAQWHELFEGQRGVCAICHGPMKQICVDHCHRTGRVRGLLCSWCNAMLACIDADGFVERALAYIAAKPRVDAFVPAKSRTWIRQGKSYVKRLFPAP